MLEDERVVQSRLPMTNQAMFSNPGMFICGMSLRDSGIISIKISTGAPIPEWKFNMNGLPIAQWFEFGMSGEISWNLFLRQTLRLIMLIHVDPT